MKTRNKLLRLEHLEKRELMAGDVRVYSTNGDLYIQGDNAANQVIVRGISSNELRVTGVVHYGAATRINGALNDVAIRGTIRNVFVSLAGGNDQLNFGSGNQVEIKAANDMSINMGAGSDWVTVRDVWVGRNLIVNTGTGAKDVANILTAAVTNEIVVGDPVQVISRADKNEVSLNRTSAKKISVLFGDGQDQVDIVVSAADILYASLGGGNDKYSMTSTKLQKSYTIDGGSGDDSFFAPVFEGQKFNARNFERINNA